VLSSVGRFADDSLNAVGEPAPVGDGVADTVGLPEGRVQDRNDLSRSVCSGDAAEACPVGEMCVRVARSVL
jgi:hypothetical protein